MTTIPHEPSSLVRRRSWIDARDMWASLAIVAIWAAVLLSAAFAPDIRTFDASGAHATIPSVVVIAVFAMFATMSVAKHGFERKARD
ncbi:MAG TPA: hypothetical protein VH968_07400 [Gaiellaceae bacterium]|jgi:hypothetical protein